MAAVDLTAFAVARHIPLDAPPGQVVADAKRPFVYVLTPSSGCVHRIACASLKADRRFQVARAATSMRVSPDGASLFVLCAQPKQLVRVALESGRVETRISLPADPFDFDLSPDGEHAAVSFGQAGSVGLIDLRSSTLHPVVIGKKLSLVRYRSDSQHVLVGNSEDRVLTILDAARGRLVISLPLAVRPDNFCFGAGHGQLFVTGEGMDAAAIVYVYQTEVAETILAGKSPGPMAEAVTESANYVLAASPQWGEVTIIDVELHKVIAVVSVGQEPGCIAVTPDNQYALVLNRASGDMAVIRLAAIKGGRTSLPPLFTIIPVGSKPVSVAVRGV